MEAIYCVFHQLVDNTSGIQKKLPGKTCTYTRRPVIQPIPNSVRLYNTAINHLHVNHCNYMYSNFE